MSELGEKTEHGNLVVNFKTTLRIRSLRKDLLLVADLPNPNKHHAAFHDRVVHCLYLRIVFR